MFSKMKTYAGAFAVLALCGGAAVAQPANNFCGDAQRVDCGSVTGTSVGANGSTTHINCGSGEFSGNNVWYEFVAPTTGTYHITTIGSSFDTVLAVFTGCEGSQLACDDDGGGNLRSALDVLLSSGQRVLIEVSGFNGATGSIVLNIDCPVEECCSPWDNGRFDRRNAQTSQIGFGEDWRIVGRVTADDFWLCEGNIYRIHTVSGQLITDSVVPKADVFILSDCDGLPGEPVAQAVSVRPAEVPASLECLLGDVTITETGQTTDDGFRIIDVTANWNRLFLKGGAYWIVIYGYSGTADPDEQFFWGTSGNQHVKGRPGQFAEFNDQMQQIEWTSIDEICCGCTDFNFCVQGEQCKILIDNGGPLVERSTVNVGEPSITNGNNTATKARAADQFVVPPCNDAWLCYIEAWVWTNCDRIRVELYDGACHLPAEAGPIASWDAICTFDTEIPAYIGGQTVTLRKAVFADFTPGAGAQAGYRLLAGHNYWLSAYALGDGRQNARGYFAFNSYCDRQCWQNFDAGAVKGPPYDSSHWISTDRLIPGGRDFAFLVAIRPLATDMGTGGGSAPTCYADINHDGSVTLQDLFDFLATYFAGCP